VALRAKPMPVTFFFVILRVLRPTIWPRALRRGPPELPGLMGASVWIQVPGPKDGNFPTALTMPFRRAFVPTVMPSSSTVAPGGELVSLSVSAEEEATK